jgi:hypothetical protein
MAKELHVLPVQIIAGESISATLVGVSATGRTCSYAFKANTPFSVACSIVDGAFVLSVSSAQSLILKAGRIPFVAMATTTEGGAVECVDSGYLSVEPNPLSTSSFSAALAAVEAAILKFASNPNRQLALDGMSITYKTLDELLSLRSFYRSEISRDLGGRGSGPMRISTRFSW